MDPVLGNVYASWATVNLECETKALAAILFLRCRILNQRRPGIEPAEVTDIQLHPWG